MSRIHAHNGLRLNDKDHNFSSSTNGLDGALLFKLRISMEEVGLGSGLQAGYREETGEDQFKC